MVDMAIAERMLTGMCDGMTIRQMCKEPGMPPRETVRRWFVDNEDLSKRYFTARQHQADAFVEEILDEARAVTNETANATKVKIDALKWLACKFKPDLYGDRVEARITADQGLTGALAQLGQYVRAAREAQRLEAQPIDITPEQG